MLSVFLFFVLPILCVCILLQRVRLLPGAEHLKETNDVAGFYITVIGAIYAVVLGFMLIAVWERFEDTEKLVSQEANLLQDVFRLAEALPPKERTEVRENCRLYAEGVIRQEWPAMSSNNSRLLPDSVPLDRLWHQLSALRVDPAHDSNLNYQLLDRFIDMNETRRSRWWRAGNTLPPILWDILLLGGILIVGFCALFGMERYSLHVLKTIILTLMVFSLLFAIWELDLPFQREITVRPEGFEQALIRFQRMEQNEQKSPNRANRSDERKISNRTPLES